MGISAVFASMVRLLILSWSKMAAKTYFLMRSTVP